MPGYDPRRHVRRGPLDTWRKKLRSDIIQYYVREMPDALLDVLEARGHIPALVERYNTRERCIRPQGGGWPWRAARPRIRRATNTTPRRARIAGRSGAPIDPETPSDPATGRPRNRPETARPGPRRGRFDPSPDPCEFDREIGWFQRERARGVRVSESRPRNEKTDTPTRPDGESRPVTWAG